MALPCWRVRAWRFVGDDPRLDIHYCRMGTQGSYPQIWGGGGGGRIGWVFHFSLDLFWAIKLLAVHGQYLARCLEYQYTAYFTDSQFRLTRR